MICLFTCCPLMAQQVKRVSVDYTYYPPETQSLAEAKLIALERAQLQSIADEFGIVITQNNSTVVNNANEHTTTSFNSFRESEVKGEWIETIKDPIYEISYESGMTVIKVHVEGKIREIISAKTDFQVKVLKNGVEPKYEDSNFRNGDDLYMLFNAPIDGYLTIYILDENDNAYCLLPYSKMNNGSFRIKANTQYLLFSEKHPSEDIPSQIIEELYMVSEKDIEHNQFYIIFSPNKFSKVADLPDTDEDLIYHPRHTDSKSFHKWLASCRKHDKEMRVDKKLITIQK